METGKRNKAYMNNWKQVDQVIRLVQGIISEICISHKKQCYTNSDIDIEAEGIDS